MKSGKTKRSNLSLNLASLHVLLILNYCRVASEQHGVFNQFHDYDGSQ